VQTSHVDRDRHGLDDREMKKLILVGFLTLAMGSCGGDSGDDDGTAIDAPSSTDGAADDGASDDGAPSDGATTDTSASTTCTDCATTTCATQYNACTPDTACACTYNCYVGHVGGEGVCKQQCNSNSNMPWADLIDCLDSMCTCP
jgi:hypothetical protein